MTPPSKMEGKFSPSSSTAAAVDLIRNLDDALSGMNASARSAATNAARARRNARAAGELARLYGLGAGGAGTGRRCKTGRESGAEADDRGGGGGGRMGGKDEEEDEYGVDGMLERKRESRAAAKMEARARQRRDHPSSVAHQLSSPSSSTSVPYSLYTSPRTRGRRHVAITTEDKTSLYNGNGNDNGEGDGYDEDGRRSTEGGGGERRGPAAAAEDVVANTTNLDDDHDGRAPATTIASLPDDHDEIGDTADDRCRRDDEDLDDDSLADQFEWDRPTQGGIASDRLIVGLGGRCEDGDGGDNNSHHHRDRIEDNSIREEDQRHRWLPPEDHPPTHNGDYPDRYGKKQLPDQNGQQQSGSGKYYPDQYGLKQPHLSPFTTASMPVPPAAAATTSPLLAARPPQATTAMTPMRIDTPSRAAIEASHVEDVLTLSLELERVRSQLASALQQLSDVTSLGDELQTRNDRLQRELTALHSRFERETERSAAELSTLRRQLQSERVKSKAAEDDAMLALELAKESQSNREECEMWLSRSLEEMDMWKRRYVELKEERRRGSDGADGGCGASLDGPRKNVRFKDEDGAEEDEYEEEGCPPSPVKSVLSADDDGYFGNDDHDVSHQRETSSTPSQPPPPPPPPPLPADASFSLLTPRQVATGNGGGAPGKICSPNIAGHATTSSVHLNEDFATPLSKSTAIACGRAVLHRTSTSSSSSPSPFGDGVILSPHPRKQAQDLLKKSAETRRLLRERLTPRRRHVVGGGSGIVGSIETGSIAKMIDDGISLKDNSFASRQGAACRAVGRAIRESGDRLKLKGIWWSSQSSRTGNSTLVGDDGNHVDGSATTQESHGNGEGGHGTVAQLESMVKDYCGCVEGTIGRQQTRIDELLAFCDHLEKEVVDMQCRAASIGQEKGG
ncbi:hypothetical protein ACHAXA_008417 [Cyclostephanos tholiformis]|uniref:Uncharacterized protein n=1 Tax=Cyclostephanos tholiformis TaxID=382380 RepID=A0ABD3SBW3_9STRA